MSSPERTKHDAKATPASGPRGISRAHVPSDRFNYSEGSEPVAGSLTIGADNSTHSVHEYVSDALGQIHEDYAAPSSYTSSEGGSSDPIYDHRPSNDNDRRKYKNGTHHKTVDSKTSTPIVQKDFFANPLNARRKPHNVSGNEDAELSSSAERNYGAVRHSITGAFPTKRKSMATIEVDHSNVYKSGKVPPKSGPIGTSPGHAPSQRRRAYSEVNFRKPSLDMESLPGYSPFEEEDEDEDEDDGSSVYVSSNPTSRRGSESSIDDVCFPVVSVDDYGKHKSWPDVSILEEFAAEELEAIKKINEASAVLSETSISDSNSSVVDFRSPLVSAVDQDSIAEPLIQSKEDETNPINGRLRPPRMTPWDTANRHDSFRAHQAMLGKFRYTYFREDMSETIHSPNISGLIQKNDMTFPDLFSPSYYGRSQSFTEPDSLNTTRDHTPQIGASTSRLGHTITSASTPAASVLDYPHTDKVDIPPFWLDVFNPTEDEMKILAKTFGIHPLTTEDIFMGEAREKVELFKDYYFVCFASFDVAQEHMRQKALEKAQQLSALEDEISSAKNENWFQRVRDTMSARRRRRTTATSSTHSRSSKSRSNASLTSKSVKYQRPEELDAVNLYAVVYRDGIITFHFTSTPHPGNVRRRIRLLRDYLTVTADWIGYALIDDIVDAYGPLIESVEREVNCIEDEILVMQSGRSHSDSEDSSDEEDEDEVWVRLKRHTSRVRQDERSFKSRSSTTSSSSSSTRVISWKRKGDMLLRIGDCRRRVMSLLRLLGSKPDVIKGFAKRCNEQWQVAPRSEIGLYLGDIQDHVMTMVQSLNHYEKVLARSHSNYLAQINIDMTKVNNDMNDILGKITILGTILLPLNIITGLWGMNCLVPGEDIESLTWFYSIIGTMAAFSIGSFLYAKHVSGIV